MESKKTAAAAQFWMYGITPIWGDTHRKLVKMRMSSSRNRHDSFAKRAESSTSTKISIRPGFNIFNARATNKGPIVSVTRNKGPSPSALPSGDNTKVNNKKSAIWLPVDHVQALGLELKGSVSQGERIISPWGDLINGDSTSDPAVLCLKVFQERRIPLKLNGTLPRRDVLLRLQKLMVDAPSQYPSLYWGSEKEVLAAGANLSFNAQGVDIVDSSGRPFTLFNAGQTTKPGYFTPDTCVAYVPFLVPEMKHNHCAQKLYWSTVRRGKANCSDEWFAEWFVDSNQIRLQPNAIRVGGRYNVSDFVDVADAVKLKDKLRKTLPGQDEPLPGK